MKRPNFRGVLVRPEVAEKQLQAETEEEHGLPETGKPQGGEETGTPSGRGEGITGADGDGSTTKPQAPKRYYGSVSLDPTRAGRDAGRVAEEVIAHLSGIVGAEVKVTLEIDAHIPSGTPEHIVRTVTENSHTLKFNTQGFEKE